MSPWLRSGAVMLLVIVLDQATKAAVRSSIALGDRDSVFPGVALGDPRAHQRLGRLVERDDARGHEGHATPRAERHPASPG